jgi:ATP-dependent protease ClpP protease subunit
MHARITLLAPINDAVFQEFAKQHILLLRDGAKELTLVISSEGGKNHAGRQFYSLLQASPLDVQTVAMGRVESSAINALCAGKRRIGLPGTTYLIHDVDFTLNGSFTRAQMIEKVRIMEVDFARNVEIISVTTGKSAGVISPMMSGAGTSMDNSAAAELGLLTEISASIPTADFEILISQNGQGPVVVQDSRYQNQFSMPGGPMPSRK